MNDKQRLALLNKSVRHLHNTEKGYKDKPLGSEWRLAMAGLEKLADDLRPDPPAKIPQLGPLFNGGKSILDHSLTHKTGGIDYYPAFDTAFVEGEQILAVEDMIVRRASSSRPGLAFYCLGDSKIAYWYGHLDRTHSAGKRFKKGEVVGRVCANSIGGGPHVHLGVNIENIAGRKKQLLYGKTGRGPDYTWGSPTIRVQLRKVFDNAA